MVDVGTAKIPTVAIPQRLGDVGHQPDTYIDRTCCFGFTAVLGIWILLRQTPRVCGCYTVHNKVQTRYYNQYDGSGVYQALGLIWMHIQCE